MTTAKEFAFHEAVERRTGVEAFFAHPYHAWEQGTNENINGLIRRLYPKGSSFAAMDRAEVRRIEQYLNDRPKKCLGWKTPLDMMNIFLAGRPS